jgi:hypothetical protein
MVENSIKYIMSMNVEIWLFFIKKTTPNFVLPFRSGQALTTG